MLHVGIGVSAMALGLWIWHLQNQIDRLERLNNAQHEKLERWEEALRTQQEIIDDDDVRLRALDEQNTELQERVIRLTHQLRTGASAIPPTPPSAPHLAADAEAQRLYRDWVRRN